MRYFFSFLLLASAGFARAQEPVGIFDHHADIGHPKNQGSATYDPANQTYTLRGSGYNIWFNRDEFQYLYRQISGDFVLTANFEFAADKGSNGHRKIGWMIRESADESAAAISACYHIDGLTAMQWRALRGAYMRDPEDEIFYSRKSPQIIQLERVGKTMTMRVAHAGEPLQLVGSHTMPDMKDTVLAGLFICAHDSSEFAEARVWNVRIDRPVAGTQVQAREDSYGSRLEVLTIADNHRSVIYASDQAFSAPNWMPDGKNLLVNKSGSLYKIPLEGGSPARLETGGIKNINNDHGISFDGKTLAISGQREGAPGGGSIIFTMPLAGGTPSVVTDQSPSYWHAWSPDGKTLLYVALHGGKVFNIYKIPAKGGIESPLTNITSGHVDGPEYSPDGKYIYYNGNQTGTMQIWRMRPDGSAKEQLTFDDYHNWFPHISPDGKWMVFLSFLSDIDPDTHPPYKRVMLRLMPLSGPSAPVVIAYFYGGQGTINVPSWSPDSKKIAFVSNYLKE